MWTDPEVDRTLALPDGYWREVPFDTYCGMNRVNSSSLREMATSPRAFKYAVSNPSDDTPSKRLGTAMHMLLLEPARFAKMRISPPINPKTGASYGADTKAMAEFISANPGRLVVSDPDLDRMQRMASSILKIRGARSLLEASGVSEETMLWTCPDTGLACKGRVDRRVFGHGRVDLKTTASVRQQDLERSVVTYGYHTQADFYRRGDEALGSTDPHHTIIFVATDPPFDVAVVTLGTDLLQIARTLNNEWLAKVRDCKAKSRWPGIMGDEDDPKYTESIVLEGPLGYLAHFSQDGI